MKIGGFWRVPRSSRRRRAPLAGLLVLVALALLTPRARAADLVEVDLSTPGDGLLTRDLDSGLDWLDPTETVGQSFEAISGGAGGFMASGFRHATTTEVCALFKTHAVAPSPCPTKGEQSSSPVGSAVPDLIALLGETFGAANAATAGVFEDGTGGANQGVASLSFDPLGNQGNPRATVRVEADLLPVATGDPVIGHFLVRSNQSTSALGAEATALGSATVQAVGGNLVISNIGSSGLDGVSLAFAATPSVDVIFQPPSALDTLTGAFLALSDPSRLVSIRSDDVGSVFDYSVDFSGLSSPTYSVVGFNGNQIVYSEAARSFPAFASVKPALGAGVVSEVTPDGEYRFIPWWDAPTPAQILGGPAIVVTRLVVTSESGGLASGEIEVLEMRMADVPDFTITGVVRRLPSFLPGDVNDDGFFDVLDGTVLRRALADLPPGITQQCVVTCGNSVLDPGEECELGTLDGGTCLGLGFTGGTLGCLEGSCLYDTSGCKQPDCDPLNPEPICGPSAHCFPMADGNPTCSPGIGSGTQGDSCTALEDCAAAFVCGQSGDGPICAEWCEAGGMSSCPVATSCTPAGVFVGSQEYGVCL